MSVVTSVIITAPCGEFEPIHEVNNWLVQNRPNKKEFIFTINPNRNNSKGCDGEKAIETELWMAGFNYFDNDTFIEMFLGLKWEGAQLFLKEEGADTFSVYENIGGINETNT